MLKILNVKTCITIGFVLFFIKNGLSDKVFHHRAYSRYSTCRTPMSSDSNGIHKHTARIIPELSELHIKGFMGNVGVIGGHNENSGAPFFAAMAALKVGADTAHIFCTIDTGDTIQTFSPDIVVHPVYNAAEAIFLQHITPMDVIIMGPGLDPQPYSVNLILKVINLCKTNKVPLVLDLDEYFLTATVLNAIINHPYPGIILTENQLEFEKLYNEIKMPSMSSYTSIHVNFDKYGNNLFILRKGCTDTGISSNARSSWSLTETGSARRTAGQGNFLAGVTGIYFLWATRNIPEADLIENGPMFHAAVATYSAAKLMRVLSSRAFEDYTRCMITSDIFEVMHDIIYDIY